jgi:hypothetical protein
MRKIVRYVVEYGMGWRTFNDYRQAEIFCGVNGLSCDNIHEEEADLDELEKWA